MCSIGVMFGSPEEEILRRINKIQSHRGPDGSKIWLDENCGFAHNRLAIVDLPGSTQPIFSDNGSVLIHNGEIYNFNELKKNNRMYNWKTKGDSESILSLHSEYAKNSKRIIPKDVFQSSEILVSKGFNSDGNPAQMHNEWIQKLDGVWGFALWDSKRNELILSRDPMGVKPLMRTIVGNSLLVASELKAFSAHPEYLPKFDFNALNIRLAYEYTLDRTTLIEGVTQVGAGVIETWSLDESGIPVLTGISRYSKTINQLSKNWNEHEKITDVLKSFKSSLVDRLMSDVPVGVVLSGGLDSSLVAALAREAASDAGKPVPECWTVADSEDNPDWIAAELVAKKFDLKHHQHILESNSFEKNLPKLVWHGEDLDVTVLFFQPLFHKMSQHVKVGLCGQGADELHAGYPRYRNLKKHIKLISSRLDVIDYNIDKEKIGLHSSWDDNNFVPSDNFSNLKKTLDFEMQRGQLSNFQLRLVDRHSMAHGLEVRVPFLGKSHWNESQKIPINWRIPLNTKDGDEKLALRRAAELTGLPKSIVKRPKLPAGKATSPSLYNDFLLDFESYLDPLKERYKNQKSLLNNQPELVLGLGLFESLIIEQDHNGAYNKSIDQLLNNIL
ncbi:MAG: asparagine synthase (glutamine-hydrolyzing) [Euryarchaeota archaeon]|nr:asparagine synthase (glutamine-hydrolyzing) [Euryarchaeota archaeon]